jgi:hypothetical protein
MMLKCVASEQSALVEMDQVVDAFRRELCAHGAVEVRHGECDSVDDVDEVDDL